MIPSPSELGAEEIVRNLVLWPKLADFSAPHMTIFNVSLGNGRCGAIPHS
jgi:hypothetical protein